MEKWKILRLNMQERLDSALILHENSYFSSSYENSFIAIELSFKSYWLKINNNQDPSQSSYYKHDLNDLIDEIPELDNHLKSYLAYNLLINSVGDSGVWKPWKRYSYRASKAESQLYANVAEGLVKWMLEHLLKD